MKNNKLSGGLVHNLPVDLKEALLVTVEAAGLWESLSPIARNEFICWIENAKQDETRARRFNRQKT